MLTSDVSQHIVAKKELTLRALKRKRGREKQQTVNTQLNDPKRLEQNRNVKKNDRMAKLEWEIKVK